MKKKILFVINTMGGAGAEMAMLEMMRCLKPSDYELNLFVLTNQGELIRRLPDYVKLLNNNMSDESVLSKEGKRHLKRYVFRAMFSHASVFRNIPYLIKNTGIMLGKRKLLIEKLLWRVLSDGAPRFTEHYDMAIAYLEGGSAYYVADHVEADCKVGFVHIDYELAGYGPSLDKGVYDTYRQIYTVSDEVRKKFLQVYPQYEKKTGVFHNIVNQDTIREKAKLPGGFSDSFAGKRILTVGRLTEQKAYEVAVEAMHLLKNDGESVRWYVVGEGQERERLEKLIQKYGLEEDFILLGMKDNPYPYYAQTDLYVHATRYEGKSIAIQEAQTLGCTILVSDCSGNREQIEDGVDGRMCELSPEGIRDGVRELLHDEAACKRYAAKAAEKRLGGEEDLQRLLSLL